MASFAWLEQMRTCSARGIGRKGASGSRAEAAEPRGNRLRRQSHRWMSLAGPWRRTWPPPRTSCPSGPNWEEVLQPHVCCSWATASGTGNGPGCGQLAGEEEYHFLIHYYVLFAPEVANLQHCHNAVKGGARAPEGVEADNPVRDKQNSW